MSESRADLDSQQSTPSQEGAPKAEGAESAEGDPTDSSVQPAAGDDSNTTEMPPPDSVSEEKPRPSVDLKDRQLGDFRLLRRIGHGGMAEVYLAEQVSLNRNVAVKILREEMLGDAVHVQRFEQEAKAAGGMNHPNIVQVYSIGQENGTHFIAQEYVQGLNLREYLSRNGPPDLKTALNFMRQVASALDASSEANVVHRDIKPENILITRKGDVKITDFGLAQLSLPGERLNLTQVGMTMGTPLYMSPEQVNGRNVDHRSDIYSFGVTCYHMLCGSTPFRGETALSVAIQHVNTDPPRLEEQRKDLPKIVCQLVHKMMAKLPEDRYQDAATLEADINRILAEVDNPAALGRLRLTEQVIPTSIPRWMLPFLGWSTRRKMAVFFICALIVGGSAAAVGYLRRSEDPFKTPPATAQQTVPRKPTARDQLMHAFLVDSEEAYKAVIENFPEPANARYLRRAREELASIYLRTRRYDEAEEIYRSFTIEDDKETKLKATGFAGLVVVASLRGKYEESNRIYANDLKPLMDELIQRGLMRTDDELYRLVEKAHEFNQQQLKSRKGIEGLLKSANGAKSGR